jgi:hypothetical protein
MSARLDSLLDQDRLADIARNDAAMGATPPPVELDEVFFARADLAYAHARADGSLDRAKEHRALVEQVRAVDQGRMV